MADVEFTDLRDRGDRSDVEIVQPVPRVDHQTEIRAVLGGAGDTLEFGGTAVVGLGIRAGMQFDDRRTGLDGRVELLLVGVDEQRYANPGFAEQPARGGDAFLLTGHVQSSLGRQLLALLRHQTAIAGRRSYRDGQHLVGDRALEVHMRPHDLDDRRQVRVLNVPAVFAQMHRDAVGARLFGDDDRLARLRIARAARLPKSSDVIDVHAQVYRVVGHCGCSGRSKERAL